MTRNNWITTSNDVCPDLVPADEFGGHTSFVQSGRRRWTFETAEIAHRFEEAVAEGRFRRVRT